MTSTVVWLKRDLRLHDHRPLMSAAKSGPIIFLYVIEPDYWALSDTSYRQYAFLRESLRDLSEQCAGIGGHLTIRVGNAEKVLADILGSQGKFRLVSHEETGNYWTYVRDDLVRSWCNSQKISFVEFKQHGIARGSRLDRNKWAQRWDAFMAEPVTPVPPKIEWLDTTSDDVPAGAELGLEHDGIVARQGAGRGAAELTLKEFLHIRGQNYRKGMSSPITGETQCSRMSPYLALGTISMREVYQATLARREDLKGDTTLDAKIWRGAMTSFVGRLHWHCHFMQKLEAEPELEWLPMAKSYSELRGLESNPERLLAFERGATGYPFVDACLRYLRATGWINFRMRAMLTSFASYDLWLRWQDSGNVLARLFTDYEPGIHWPQAQMQSGETGINAIRIYSPVKQGYDHDPKGDFTREWVPELSGLTGKSVHEPWKAEREFNYPDPIIDHAEAVREAKSRIWAIRSSVEAKREAEDVYKRHGSRRGPRRRRKVQSG